MLKCVVCVAYVVRENAIFIASLCMRGISSVAIKNALFLQPLAVKLLVVKLLADNGLENVNRHFEYV